MAIDAALTAAGATPALAHSIEAAGPFGAGNPEPIFALPRHRLVDVFAVGADHLRLRAVAGDGRAIEAIAFRAVGKPLGEALLRLKGANVHLAGRARDQPLRRAREGAAAGRRRGGSRGVAADSGLSIENLRRALGLARQ